MPGVGGGDNQSPLSLMLEHQLGQQGGTGGYGLSDEISAQRYGRPLRGRARADGTLDAGGQKGQSNGAHEMGAYGMAAEIAGTAGIERPPAGLSSSMLLDLRPEPLRPSAVGGRAAHGKQHSHPERMVVDLQPYTLPGDMTVTAYLLDQASGLVYYGPQGMQWMGHPSDASGEYGSPELQHQQQQQAPLWQRRQQAAPSINSALPYPELAGRLRENSTLVPAGPANHLHRVFLVLAGIAADEYRLSTMYKLKDRWDSNGVFFAHAFMETEKCNRSTLIVF